MDRGQRFKVKEISPRIFQLIESLGRLHAVAAHGFLKPENIFLQANGVCVTDTGLLQALPRQEFITAQIDNDSAAYLAPEVRSGAAATKASDVYSLGTIIYELLTGEVYREGGQKISEANLSIQGQALTALDAFIERAVAKDSAHRFRSMEELGEAFSSLLESLTQSVGHLALMKHGSTV